jgi:hypothetical protein
MGVLGHIEDDDEARSIVSNLLAGLPAGSYLAIADGSNVLPPAFEQAQRAYDEGGSVPYKLRHHDQITWYFDGLELLEPGIVPVTQWRPEVAPIADEPEVQPLAGIGRKG